MYIGQVAKITGASCKAIRHYESIGLIPPPARRGKYRVYSKQDIFLIHMIKHAQSVGFGLKELNALVLEKISGARFPLQLANELLERKRADLHAEMSALNELLRRLEVLRKDMNRVFGKLR